jgi:hypothetical protein
MLVKCKSTLWISSDINSIGEAVFKEGSWYDEIDQILGDHHIICELGEVQSINDAMYNITFYSLDELRDNKISIIIDQI